METRSGTSAEAGASTRPKRKRRRRLTVAAFLVLGVTGVVAPVTWAITWALTATPAGALPSAGPLPPQMAELLEACTAVSVAGQTVLSEAVSDIEGVISFDLEVLLRDDAGLDANYFDGPFADGPDASEMVARRSAIRAKGRELAATLVAQGLPASVTRHAPPAGSAFTPVPIGVDPPLDFGRGQMDLQVAAGVLARIALRENDPATALQWLAAMRGVADAGESLPSQISLLVSSATRMHFQDTITKLVADSRAFADRVGPDTVHAFLDELVDISESLGPLAPARRRSKMARYEFENLLRECTDSSGRVVATGPQLGPWLAPPTAATRLKLNLPGLFGPTRRQILATAEPAIARFAAQTIEIPMPAPPDVAPLDFDGFQLSGPADPETLIASAIEGIARSHAMFLHHAARELAHRHGIRIGVAIERHRLDHGASPRTLDELGLPPEVLINPWTGTPLEYVPGDPNDGYRWQLRAAGRRTGGEAFDLRLHPEAFEPLRRNRAGVIPREEGRADVGVDVTLPGSRTVPGR